jgi:hypothetical protein
MHPFLYRLITARELLKAAALILVLFQVLAFGLGHGQPLLEFVLKLI